MKYTNHLTKPLNLDVLQNHWPLTSHQQPTHRQPTTNYRSTDKCSTNKPLTDNQHRPTDKCFTDPPTTNNQPPTHLPLFHWLSNLRPPTHHQVLYRPKDHRFTDSPPILQLTTNPLTQEFYSNSTTIGLILSITNFNSSYGMGIIYYWIGKIIYEMIGKKESLEIANFVDLYTWKLLEWENWRGISFFRMFSFEIFLFLSLVFMLQNVFH